MGGWGGGTLIFSYKHRIWLFFFFGGGGGGGGGGQNIEFQYFWGYSEDFVDIFGGSSQNWTIFRGHFFAF